MTILSEDQIAEIEARHAAASRGTWLGGPEAKATGKLYPDWGYVWAHTPGEEHPFTLIFEGCNGSVASEEEKSACRAKSIELRRAGAECDWTEPAQVAANRRFIEAAHNTDIPALVASHRELMRRHTELARMLERSSAAGMKAAAERDALKAQLEEWEIAADEGYGDAMTGVAITPDWFRGKRREADRLRDALSLQVARLKEARRDALEEAAKIAEEWHVWYEKPGSGTRHALCVARDIRAASLSNPTGGDRE